MFAFVNRGVRMGVGGGGGGHRAAVAEQERRRADINTYTKPLDMSAGGSEMKDFLTDFYRHVIFRQVEEMKAERERYPDTVGKYYKDLVPSKMNNEDFWQRYYYRCCSLERINAQLLQQKQQPAPVSMGTQTCGSAFPASAANNNNNDNNKQRKNSITATLNASFQNLMASVSSINSNNFNNSTKKDDKDDVIFASQSGEGEEDDPVQFDFRNFANTSTATATATAAATATTNSSIGTGAGEHTKSTPMKIINSNTSDDHAATTAPNTATTATTTAVGDDGEVILSVKKEEEEKKGENCYKPKEDNKTITLSSSKEEMSAAGCNEETQAPAAVAALARKQRRRSSMEQSNRTKNGVLEWTAWKRRPSSSSRGSDVSGPVAAAAEINSLVVEGPAPVQRESVRANIPQEWVNVTIEEEEEEKEEENCNKQMEDNKTITPSSSKEEITIAGSAVARKQRRWSSMEQSNRTKNGVLEWTAWKRRPSSSRSSDVSASEAVAARMNSLLVEGPAPVKRESVRSNLPQEWVNVTIAPPQEEEEEESQSGQVDAVVDVKTVPNEEESVRELQEQIGDQDDNPLAANVSSLKTTIVATPTEDDIVLGVGIGEASSNANVEGAANDKPELGDTTTTKHSQPENDLMLAMKDQAKKDQALKEATLPKKSNSSIQGNDNIKNDNVDSGSSGLAAMAAAWSSTKESNSTKGGDVARDDTPSSNEEILKCALAPEPTKEKEGRDTATANHPSEEEIATAQVDGPPSFDEGSGTQAITQLQGKAACAKEMVPETNETTTSKASFMSEATPTQVVVGGVQKAFGERDVHRIHATLLGFLVSIIFGVVFLPETSWNVSLMVDQLCSPLPPNQVLNISAATVAGSRSIDDEVLLGVAPWWVPDSYDSYKPDVFRHLCGPNRLQTKVSLGQRKGLFSWLTGPNHILIIEDLNSFDTKPLVLKKQVQNAVLSPTSLEVKIKSGKTEFIPVPWSKSTPMVGGK